MISPGFAKVERARSSLGVTSHHDHVFEGLLQQMLEEHKKIVNNVREDLLIEINKLRKENSQLRGEHAPAEQEGLGQEDEGLGQEDASPRETISNTPVPTAVEIPEEHVDSNHASTGVSSPPSGVGTSKAMTLPNKVNMRRSASGRSHANSSISMPSRMPRSATTARLMAYDEPDRYMISPVSRAKLLWDFIAFSCLLLDLWATPVQLVFMAEDVVPMELHVLNIMIISFFVIDMILNFNTGFVDRDRLVMARLPSIKRYLTLWFWIDMMATVPFDLILGFLISRFDGDVFSMARLARLTKLMKMLKTLRFLRLLRMVKIMKNMGRTRRLLESSWSVKCASWFIQLFGFIAFMAHLQGCVWAMLQTGMVHQRDIDLAFMNYYQSLRWAYNAFCAGEMGASLEENPGIWTLEMIIATERIFMAILVGGWGVVNTLAVFQEDAKLNLLQSDAVRFFQQNHVSTETQISVMYCLHETRAVQKMQRHFKVLMSDHLPEELRRTVSEELWVSHLCSLDLIWHMRWWSEDFVPELSLLVREEVVASKTLLCRQGHPSISAYYILKGRLQVVPSNSKFAMPDFTDGMWVEETALVNPFWRRNNTIVSSELTRLMTVPTQAFHDLIASLGLQQKFQDFRERRLTRGLCGRCGDVGDHFTHACPHASNPSFARDRRKLMRKKTQRISNSEHDCNFSVDNFLHAHRLTSLGPLLQEQNVRTKAELEDLDFKALGAKLEGNEELLKELALLRDLVRESKEQAMFQVSDEMASAQHLVFLSHYKMESGTEAALMRQELERVLLEDNEPVARSLHVPIFLDSEDLSDLKELQEHVRRSHNLVLLLTKDVLLRPWVLVEIVTAIDSDVRVVPVTVSKTGAGFVFPDDNYYAKLVAGETLDSDGVALLRELGIRLKDVEQALRNVFLKIALPYSPHRSETIRMAEVNAIYKQLLQCPPRLSLVSEGETSRHTTRQSTRTTRLISDDSAILPC